MIVRPMELVKKVKEWRPGLCWVSVRGGLIIFLAGVVRKWGEMSV